MRVIRASVARGCVPGVQEDDGKQVGGSAVQEFLNHENCIIRWSSKSGMRRYLL